MALVEGNTKATGYGQAPAPFVPAYGGVVDDNTAYNAVVNGAPPVMAKVTPPPVPTVIDPVNAQKLPNIWDSRYQTWRDPNTNLLAIGSDATGWDWVTEDRYAVLKPPAVPAAAPPAPVAQVSSFAGAQGNIGPTALPSGGTLADWANRGAVNKAAEKALSSVMGEDVLNVPWKDVPKFPVSAQPEDAYMFDYSGRTGLPMVSDQDAYYQLTHPYAYEETLPRDNIAATRPGQSSYPWEQLGNATSAATDFASRTTGAKWDTGTVAAAGGVAPEMFPDWGRKAYPPNAQMGGFEYTNPLYAGASQPALSASDPLYPSEANYRTWLQNWPYYTPETRAMLSQVIWAKDRVEVGASGGGGYAPWDNTIHANRLDDEPLVHELAHAYYSNDPVMSQVENRKAFVDALRKLANETDPAYAWPAYLAKTYYLPAIDEELKKGAPLVPGWDVGGEQHGGLWSGVMGNIYQLPSYMWDFYSGMFDTSRFTPEATQRRFGSGYKEAPLTYGPSNLAAPVNNVSVPPATPKPPPPPSTPPPVVAAHKYQVMK